MPKVKNVKEDGNRAKLTRGKVQSVFTLPSDKKPVICNICSMSYHKNESKQVEIHKKYHDHYTNGIPWIHMDEGSIKDTFIRGLLLKYFTIDKLNKKQVKKTEDLLLIVNKELNASIDSENWKDINSTHSKAFILLKDNRAIGIITTDELLKNDGKWMIASSQTIVPSVINELVKIGISRIWIAPNFRRLGLAQHLLQFILSELIYGEVLKPLQIAFSQPSTRGLALSKKFNGVKHKLGELLIPVYDS